MSAVVVAFVAAAAAAAAVAGAGAGASRSSSSSGSVAAVAAAGVVAVQAQCGASGGEHLQRAMASHLLRHLCGDHKPHSAEAWAHGGVSMDDTSCEVKFQRYSTAALASQLPTPLRSRTHI